MRRAELPIQIAQAKTVRLDFALPQSLVCVCIHTIRVYFIGRIKAAPARRNDMTSEEVRAQKRRERLSFGIYRRQTRKRNRVPLYVLKADLRFCNAQSSYNFDLKHYAANSPLHYNVGSLYDLRHMLRRKEIKKTQSKKSAWQKTIHKTNSDFSIIQKRRNNKKKLFT
jgi:hypothetical protein